MLKIERTTEFYPSLGKTFDMYFSDKKLCIFDIETTGLNPASGRLILSGMITVSDNRAAFTQLLAENISDEEEIIRRTCLLLDKSDVIITYNGRHFDVPFLTKRASVYGIDVPLKYNFDLYMLISGYSSLRQMLGGLKQKDIESFMGIDGSRDDRISGLESVKLFEKYLNTGSFALRDKILLHNADDIRQLYRLLPVIRSTDIHRAISRLGFPVQGGFVSGYTLSGRCLTVRGFLEDAMDYISFLSVDMPYSVRISSRDSSAEVVFDCAREKNLTFLDAQLILGGSTDTLSGYPGFESGYLICSSDNNTNYTEINLFIRDFFSKVLPRIFV